MRSEAIKLLVLSAMLASCANDAITYAHLIDPNADCSSHNLYSSGPDTAVCRFSGKVWWCTGPSKDGRKPYCDSIVDIPAEAK